MSSIPAICDACGAWFASGLVMTSIRSAYLAGNTAGPCPACGAMGTIPDGMYRALGGTLDVLLNAPRPELSELKAELEELKMGLEQLRQQDAPSPSETQDALERHRPGLGRYVPQDPKDLATYILVLLAAVQLVHSFLVSGAGVPNPDEIADTVVERLLEADMPERPKDAPEA
jgi:hypothetical protein